MSLMSGGPCLPKCDIAREKQKEREREREREQNRERERGLQTNGGCSFTEKPKIICFCNNAPTLSQYSCLA